MADQKEVDGVVGEISNELGYLPTAAEVWEEYRGALADQREASPNKGRTAIRSAAIAQVVDHYQTWDRARVESGEKSLSAYYPQVTKAIEPSPAAEEQDLGFGY